MLSDPMATARTRSLFSLIEREQGKRILLAQQESPSRHAHDMETGYLLKLTGRLPAVRGLDFIHQDFDGVVDRALAWNERGGIVTVCWHTGVTGTGYPESQSESPDPALLLSEGTPENTQLLRRWDEAAAALKRLADADVPVLWRPFHEFDGRWFWWGKIGPEAFVRLWRMMYRYLTEVHGLHNLIWVLGYADDVNGGWYPGSAYCDILGSDTYRGVTTHAGSYAKLKALDSGKPLAFHECGKLPEPDAFFREGAPWSYVMPWHSKWLTEDNDAGRLLQVYHDERMITLQDLPSF